MRPPVFHAHPFAFAIALLGWIVVLAPTPPGADRQARTIDRTSAIEPPQSPPRRTPLTEASPTRGGDVVLEDYPLRAATVRRWRANELIEVPDADGVMIALRIERDSNVAGRRHLTLTHDGLVSTFTQSGDRYFGTLATATGVYALDGDDRAGHLTRHALLDQRTNPHATDYRTPPAP
jgi:hypothetical protein